MKDLVIARDMIRLVFFSVESGFLGALDVIHTVDHVNDFNKHLAFIAMERSHYRYDVFRFYCGIEIDSAAISRLKLAGYLLEDEEGKMILPVHIAQYCEPYKNGGIIPEILFPANKD